MILLPFFAAFACAVVLGARNEQMLVGTMIPHGPRQLTICDSRRANENLDTTRHQTPQASEPLKCIASSRPF